MLCALADPRVIFSDSSAAQKICMLLAYIPMVLVLMLIFTDVYVLNYIWAPFKYTDEPVFTTIATVVFDILVVLLVTSYLRCIFTSSAQRHNTPPVEWDESDPFTSFSLFSNSHFQSLSCEHWQHGAKYLPLAGNICPRIF